jgi:hypothetical protein
MLLFSTVVGERAIVGHTLMNVASGDFVNTGMVQNLLERMCELAAFPIGTAK